jgi:hypothetical protein
VRSFLQSCCDHLLEWFGVLFVLTGLGFIYLLDWLAGLAKDKCDEEDDLHF